MTLVINDCLSTFTFASLLVYLSGGVYLVKTVSEFTFIVQFKEQLRRRQCAFPFFLFSFFFLLLILIGAAAVERWFITYSCKSLIVCSILDSPLSWSPVTLSQALYVFINLTAVEIWLSSSSRKTLLVNATSLPPYLSIYLLLYPCNI